MSKADPWLLCVLSLLLMLALSGRAPATPTENLGIPVLPAPGNVAIDGRTGDWDLSGGIFACPDVETQRETLAAWIHLMYDRENLYVLARWKDDSPMNNPAALTAKGVYGFFGDCLQIRLSTAHNTPRERCSHLTCWRGKDGNDRVEIAYGKGADTDGIKNAAATDGARQVFVADADAGGYAQEIALPWKLVTSDGKPLRPGDRLKVTIMANFTTGDRQRTSIRDILNRLGKGNPDYDFIYPVSDAWGAAVVQPSGSVMPEPVRLADGREFPVTMAGPTPTIDWAALDGKTKQPGPAGNTLTITFPPERYVKQRGPDDSATITVKGKAPVPMDFIEVRAILSPGVTRGRSVYWTRLSAIDNGAFKGMLPLAAGGWYRLEFRAVKDRRIVAAGAVEKVGVGEVFIAAGQSNSGNSGRPRQEARDDRVVYMKDDGTFVPAHGPIPGSTVSDQGTPWPLVGDLLARSIQVPICFRGATLQHTEVEAWLPGTGLYSNLIKQAERFGPNGVRAVLWHQGELDTLGTTARQYRDRLAATIRSMRKKIGYDIDWFVAAAAYYRVVGRNYAGRRAVIAGQKMLWRDGIAFQGPTTEDLGPVYRTQDHVHFNQLGLQTHADRWFAMIYTRYFAEEPLTPATAEKNTAPEEGNGP